MKNLAIIPARGGSKRIPGKNIKPFLGKPIIAYSIETALNSGLFDEVMVSTDDDEIAKVAQRYGASVPFKRSSKNAGDFANTVDALLEVLDQYEALGKSFDYACCIYPTAPFITIDMLKKSFQKIKDSDYNSIFPAILYPSPIQRAFTIASSGKIQLLQPEYFFRRSQDLEPVYYDCGQFYWFKPKVVIKTKNVFTDNTGVIILSEMDTHDIDTPEDWKMAEFKYQFLRNAKK